MDTIAELVKIYKPMSDTVSVTTGTSVMEFEVSEINGRDYARMAPLAGVRLPNGSEVFDMHRFRAIRIICALSGESAIPGATPDAKIGHMMDNGRGGKEPAVDVVAGLPKRIFEALDEAVERVNASSVEGEGILQMQLASIGDLWKILRVCAEKGWCLKDLKDKEVHMQEISMWDAFYQARRDADEAKANEILANAGKG